MKHELKSSSPRARIKGIQKRLPENELGIYLPGKKYLRIIQQPKNTPAFVSDRKNAVTSFSLSKHYGNLGYLAHNYLAGKYFSDMQVGDEIVLLVEDGIARHYQITNKKEYCALQPTDPRSRFINLENNAACSAGDVFKEVYMGEERVVLQTCIARGGHSEWGRMFLIAKPIERLDNRFSAG